MPDKTVTQVPVTAGEIMGLHISREGLLHATAPYLDATYTVKDSVGAAIGHHRVAHVPLTEGQVTTLQNFVTNVVIPAVNAQEGT
jgi:hypothetical protein